jgi:4-hydroxythreonine-4-phosphate dehydrogenase
MARTKLPIIGITMGDPTGVGPEIIVKVLSHESTFRFCRPVVLGDRNILERALKLLNIPLAVNEMEAIAPGKVQSDALNLLPLSALPLDKAGYGKPTKACGEAMVAYITEAARLASEGTIEAITTAPISKKALSDAGYSYPGHTELLAELTGSKDYVMMLAGERLRVVLVTIHCSLRDVFHLLTTEKIVKTISITNDALRDFFGEARPRIAVAALNPHAGEEGLFGSEEKTIILPAIERARKSGINVEGPLPPDTLFYHAARGGYGAVVSMYHDQGLIPLKLLHFEDAVNITLGLPLIRTSVDHGTAYDIAGTGKANPSSLLNALKIAARMAAQKKNKAPV